VGHQSLGDLTVTPTPVTHRPPPRHGTATVRPARLANRDELDQIVTGFHTFSADHLLAPSVTALDLQRWAATELDGRPLNAYFVAIDTADRIVAGLGIEREAALTSLEVTRMPTLTRAASRLLRVVPTDGKLHNLNIKMAWFAPGHEAAARQLWQSVRFEIRSEGTTLVTTLAQTHPSGRCLPPDHGPLARHFTSSRQHLTHSRPQAFSDSSSSAVPLSTLGLAAGLPAKSAKGPGPASHRSPVPLVPRAV
jgi:hypothetical protein